MKNKYVASLFAFVLWGIGAHKFYLWKNLQGFIYLLFFWTYIPAIIWFLEWLVYLLNTQEDFDINYNIHYLKSKQFLKNEWERTVSK